MSFSIVYLIARDYEITFTIFAETAPKHVCEIRLVRGFQAYRFDHVVELHIQFGFYLILNSNGLRPDVLERRTPNTVNLVSRF